jgi:hypothetical protein
MILQSYIFTQMSVESTMEAVTEHVVDIAHFDTVVG